MQASWTELLNCCCTLLLTCLCLALSFDVGAFIVLISCGVLLTVCRAVQWWQMVLVASTCSHACALDRGSQAALVRTTSVTCLLGTVVSSCGVGLQCVIRAGLDICPVNSTVGTVMLSNRLGFDCYEPVHMVVFWFDCTCCAPLAAAVQLYVSMCKEQCLMVCFLQKHCTHFRPHLLGLVDLRSEGRNFCQPQCSPAVLQRVTQCKSQQTHVTRSRFIDRRVTIRRHD
jgi:hypothetical protein